MSTEDIQEISKKYPVGILIFGLDDDETVKEKVAAQMKINGIYCEIFTDVELFIKSLYLKPDICFVDYRLQNPLDGIQITNIITSQNPDCEVIMVSGVSIRHSGDLLKDFFVNAGGKDWIEKDGIHWVDELIASLQRTIDRVKIKLERKKEIEDLKQESQIRKRKKEERESASS